MPPKLVNLGAILFSFKARASLAARSLQQKLCLRQIGIFNTEGLERCFEQRRQHIRGKKTVNTSRWSVITHSTHLQKIYITDERTTTEETEAWNTNTSAIFTNSELSLKRVDVYGFDFDYTLIHYTVELHKFIYENAKDYLVGKAGVRVYCVCVCVCVCVVCMCVCVHIVVSMRT